MNYVGKVLCGFVGGVLGVLVAGLIITAVEQESARRRTRRQLVVSETGYSKRVVVVKAA